MLSFILNVPPLLLHSNLSFLSSFVVLCLNLICTLFLNILYLFFKCLFILRESERERERERERAWAWGGEGQRERERENPKQSPCCQHRAWFEAWFHKPWDHDLRWNRESEAVSAQSVKHLTLAHGSWVWALHQVLCWQLRAWNLLRSLCLPCSLPLPHSCFVLFF